jgi:hypothetical protein
VGPQTEMVSSQRSVGVSLAPGYSSWFRGVLGAEVDGAWDGFWRRCFTAWLYLVAKPSHVGVDVDGLACPLHHPMTCSHQTRGHGLLPGTVLSCHCSGRWCLFGGCEAPELGYLVRVESFLLGHTYPMSESSWRLGVYP